MSFIYILELSNGRYYVGSCRDLKKRLLNHKQGQVKSTKYKLPFKLKYAKEYLIYPEARSEELRIKSWKKRKSIENLCKFDKTNVAGDFGAIV